MTKESKQDDAAADGGTSSSPNIWTNVANNCAVAAGTGALFGTILATYRGHSVPFYATNMFFNYGIASFTLFGSEALIRKMRGGKRDALGYAGGGAIAGLVMTVPIGGRYNALVAAVTLAGVSYGGFHAHRKARLLLDDMGHKRLKARQEKARAAESSGGDEEAGLRELTSERTWGNRR